MKWFCKMNTPNKLTIVRIFGLTIIVIVFFLPLNQIVFSLNNIDFDLKRILIFFIFIFSAITDYLDGKIARKRGIVTTFGKFLDPIADKILINTLFIMLAWQGEIHLIIPIIFITRDTLVDAVRLIMVEKNVVIAASNLGKLKTASQMIALTLLLINNVPFVFINIPLDIITAYIAAIISIISGFDYVYKNRKTLFEGSDYNGK